MTSWIVILSNLSFQCKCKRELQNIKTLNNIKYHIKQNMYKTGKMERIQHINLYDIFIGFFRIYINMITVKH